MNSRHDEALWSSHKTNRRSSALRQIEAAIDHLNAGQLECAVTLALAAEDQLPDSDEPYLFKVLKDQIGNEMKVFNTLRNWLKHHVAPDEIEFSDFEVAIALVRATSKFFATYRQSSPKIEAFVAWCQSKGLLGTPDVQRLPSKERPL
jgi:hypothetical protein